MTELVRLFATTTDGKSSWDMFRNVALVADAEVKSDIARRSELNNFSPFSHNAERLSWSVCAPTPTSGKGMVADVTDNPNVFWKIQWEDFTCKQILVLLAWKGVRKVANFPIANFCHTFFFHYFLTILQYFRYWKQK